jgi:hypothetical protein
MRTYLLRGKHENSKGMQRTKGLFTRGRAHAEARIFAALEGRFDAVTCVKKGGRKNNQTGGWPVPVANDMLRDTHANRGEF